jgi:tetratricopeptide (TPR) repeat protein
MASSHIYKVVLYLCLSVVSLNALCTESAVSVEQAREEVYIEALVLAKRITELHTAIDKALKNTADSDTPRLLRLAQTAMANNLTETALAAFERIHKHDPDNLTAIRNIGMLLFWNRKYSMALKFLNIYNTRTGGNYISIYYQGESLYMINRTAGPAGPESRPYFEKVLTASESFSGIKQAALIRAQSYFRLGEYKKSFDIYERMIKRYPDDIYIITDYARMLQADKRMEMSFQVLKRLPENLYAPDSLKRYGLPLQARDSVIVNIAIMRIAYYLDKRDFFVVKRMQEELRKHYPDNPDAALSRATFYGAIYNWRGELENYDLAAKSYPEDESIIASRKRIIREHGSFVENKSGIRLSDNDGFEFINEVNSEIRISDDIRLGINLLTDVARLNKVPRMDNGETEQFKGVRNQAHIFLQGDLVNGDTARISFFDHDTIPGLGAAYTLLDFWGSTRLEGAWRRPYWGQQQAIAERGSRTYMELERIYRPFEDLTLSAKGSLNSYGLEHSSDLARSLAAGASASYTLPRFEFQKRLLGDVAAFSLIYDLDMEFFDHFKTRDDGTRIYAPDNRQVHTFLLSFYNEFTEDFKASIYGGFALDAMGSSSGPAYGASISYRILEDLELSGTVSQTLSSNQYFYVGIELKYNFTPLTLVELFKRGYFTK